VLPRFPWSSPPPDPETRPHVRLAGAVLPPGAAAATVKRWWLSRGLYRVSTFDLADVPASRRREVLPGLLKAWAPFDRSDYLVGLRGTRALAFAWDASAVVQRLAAAGAAPDALLLPESLMRRPPAGDGLRLLAGIEGVEAEVWQDGLLLATRWWPHPPDDQTWHDFVRGQVVAAKAAPQGAPEAVKPTWSDRAWLECQALATLQAPWSRLEQVAALALLLGLVGLTAALAHDAFDTVLASSRLSEQISTARAAAGPLQAQRERALAAASEAALLARALAAVQPLDVLRHLGEVLPPRGVTLRDFELAANTLRLGLELDPQVQRSAIVRDLQSGGWFTGVSEQRDVSGRGGVNFEMQLASIGTPALPLRSALAASAPGAR